MNKNTNVWLITPLTNLHAGDESVVSFTVIDKTVQRDATTGLPCINSSSLKGAVKEYLEEETSTPKEVIKELFGSSKKGKDTQKGSAIFFDSAILFIPERLADGRQTHQLVYDKNVLNDFVEKAKALGINCDAQSIIQKAGGTPTAKFKKLCDDEHLPIIARNCLENGESVNLWYEQVVPLRSVFATIISGDLDMIDGKIIQVGGNATIGYGYCKFEKLG